MQCPLILKRLAWGLAEVSSTTVGVLAGWHIPEGPTLSPQQAGKGRTAAGPCQLGGTGRACKDKKDRTGAHLLWPSCSVSWQWAKSELWCRQCGERNLS